MFLFILKVSNTNQHGIYQHKMINWQFYKRKKRMVMLRAQRVHQLYSMIFILKKMEIKMLPMLSLRIHLEMTIYLYHTCLKIMEVILNRCKELVNGLKASRFLKVKISLLFGRRKFSQVVVQQLHKAKRR